MLCRENMYRLIRPKKNSCFLFPDQKKLGKEGKKNILRIFFFINLEHVCNNQKNENIHSL